MYAMSVRDWCGSYRRTLQTTLHGWKYVHAVAAATTMPVIHNEDNRNHNHNHNQLRAKGFLELMIHGCQRDLVRDDRGVQICTK